MLRDTLLCRDVISGVSRKVWRHTKFTLDKIDSASEPKKTTRKRVKRSKIVYHCVAKLEFNFSVSRSEKFENHWYKQIKCIQHIKRISL